MMFKYDHLTDCRIDKRDAEWAYDREVSWRPDTFELRTIKLSPSSGWRVWVLSDHYEHDPVSGQPSRTYVGNLTYEAKYLASRPAMEELQRVMSDAVVHLRGFPPRKEGLSSVTSVAAVPCNPPKPLSVPHELAAAVAQALGVADVSKSVVKVRETTAAKTSTGLHSDCYKVHLNLQGETVLLVDDLIRTGATLESVAINLRKAGCEHVVGICATSARKGMNS
jgi:hypothetical protein